MRNPEKSALRKQFRRARAQMSADERNAATETINRLLKPYIKKGRKIGAYPADGAKQERKRGRAKLHVPQFTGKKIRVHQLSLLLVPIVGIDKRGYRLGQAGGYYDATLSAMKYHLQTQTLGVGFGCQLTDTLPTEPHDIPLNGFVSELGVLKFRRPR